MPESELPQPSDAEGRRSASKKLLRGSTLMLVGRLFSIVVNFGVQVLTVRFLVKSDYGAFAYAMSFVTMGSSIAVFGLGKTVSRFVPIYQERQQYREMAGTVILALGSALALGGFLVLFAHGVEGMARPYLSSDPLSVSLLLVLITLSPIQAIENIFEGLFAVFASPLALFARRFLVGPLLKLAAVLPLVFFHSSAWILAWSNVAAGAVGILYSGLVLFGVLRKSGELRHFRPSTLRLPAKSIFAFSAPMVLSDLLPTVRVALVSIILETFRGTLGVASFRAVLPLARLNHAPRDSFRLLFTPTLSRMYARGDREGVEHAYWQSTIWIAVLTFPFFILSFALSDRLAVWVFGSKYADAADLLALLTLGYYLSAALGFSTYALRIYGLTRRIFINDLLTAGGTILLAVFIIPRFGVTGAACVTGASLVLGMALNKLAVVQQGIVRSIEPAALRSLLAIALGTALVVAIRMLGPAGPLWPFVAAVLASLLVLWASLPALEVGTTFPELGKFIPWLHRSRAVEKP